MKTALLSIAVVVALTALVCGYFGMQNSGNNPAAPPKESADFSQTFPTSAAEPLQPASLPQSQEEVSLEAAPDSAKSLPRTATPNRKPPPPKKPPPQDPIARDALTLVGIDPEAEEYWYGAINDARLSAQEREDLIEDLNEHGFADPKNLTLADLPLIVNRLLIIEQLAPEAMDKVNADAFAEAYKDLVNMYGRVVAQ